MVDGGQDPVQSLRTVPDTDCLSSSVEYAPLFVFLSALTPTDSLRSSVEHATLSAFLSAITLMGGRVTEARNCRNFL